MTDYETYKLGDWELQNGGTIPDAHIAFRTFGDPKSPAIVYPTWYSGGNGDRRKPYTCRRVLTVIQLLSIMSGWLEKIKP